MKKFSEFKTQAISKLSNCKKILNEAKDHISVNDYLEKIDRTIEDLKEEKLKVVFFGGFSDGKTTILSALLNRTDLKISPAPTTDKIEEYKFEDFIVIDTPGLFSEQEEHDEKTKHYISEADLIIFTTDAVNPLKESQHPTIKWLLKDLGKLNQTIFVINKLDETGIDIENREDFDKMCSTKKEVVVSTLNNILEEERDDYLTVCLIADPWGMGIKHWLNNREEYERLSNIKQLEEIIDSVIKSRKYDLIQEKVNSVLQDIILNTQDNLSELIEVFQERLADLEIKKKELESELNGINSQLVKASNRIKNRLDSLRRDLISSVASASNIDELKQFIQTEIGNPKEAEALKSQIEQIYNEELEDFHNYLFNVQKILEEIALAYEEIDDLILNVAQKLSSTSPALKGLLTNTSETLIKSTIFKTRKIFSIPIKFKPWGANKLATNISTIARIGGVILDVAVAAGKIYSDIKFNNKKEELKNNINSLFGELIKNTNPEVLKEIFPVVAEYEKEGKIVLKQYEETKENLEKLKKLNNVLTKCKAN
ncbi:LeoA/HP0731 family dynamin-like GTPase [Hydrogenothermus marinus]|uniref:Small GTP-binding protein n=1 Tax=Hydrogenothermus marinus TaxID=133270 RepID=A0A3M0B6P1_9AQUI|nr:LeoA/HP0731 family dynamin-like GTPase [Hydrogenothermus marinus]RMA93080.1 small GTP-binding protein [Hydrogenothermus marinus]